MAEKEKFSTTDYDKEAYTHFMCEGLCGKGCGTNPKKVSYWRKEKSWEEKRRTFLQREGD